MSGEYRYPVNTHDVSVMSQFVTEIAPNKIVAQKLIRSAERRANENVAGNWNNRFVCELMRKIADGLVFGRWPC